MKPHPKLPETESGCAVADKGIVVLDGPDGVAVSMTPESAKATADSLHAAAADARPETSGTDD